MWKRYDRAIYSVLGGVERFVYAQIANLFSVIIVVANVLPNNLKNECGSKGSVDIFSNDIRDIVC